MATDTRLEASLLLMRVAIAAFLLVWALDKVIAPEHARAVFSHFYFVPDAAPLILKAVGILQIGIVLAFGAGFARSWTYGAVLLMHAASTASTYAHLVAPWAEGSQLLFWAAVPVLAAVIALFLLRDRDRLLSIDAALAR
ncbi:MAG: hypothetical protein AB7V46_01760 [Thermomicrobiales bacterium]